MLPTFPVGTADKRKNGRACKTLPKAAEQAEQRNKCAFCSVALRSALRHNNKKGSDLLIGYKADGAEVYQNGQNGATITWYHRDVLPGQLFGRVNGVPFVADPFINNKGFVPMFVRKKCANKNGTTSVKWVFEHPTEFVNAIKKAFMAHKIRLYSWKCHVDGLAASKIAAESETEQRQKIRQERAKDRELRSIQANKEVAGHKPSKHTKAFRGKNNASLPSEYVGLSRQNYGERIDFGNIVRPMNASLASYMDGVH